MCSSACSNSRSATARCATEASSPAGAPGQRHPRRIGNKPFCFPGNASPRGPSLILVVTIRHAARTAPAGPGRRTTGPASGGDDQRMIATCDLSQHVSPATGGRGVQSNAPLEIPRVDLFITNDSRFERSRRNPELPSFEARLPFDHDALADYAPPKRRLPSR
jgi:hypothetical protein